MAQAKNNTDNTSAGVQPQPGTVVRPGGSSQSVEPDQPPTDSAIPTVAPEDRPATTPPQSEATSEPAPTSPAVPDAASDEASDDAPDNQSVSWTASEFLAHDKPAGWYVIVAAGSFLLAALVFFLTRDAVSTGVVIVAGLLLGVYGSHKPRQLEYIISQRGIGIGGKHHSYNEFRSFSVASEGAFSSLVLMPLKRFSVPLTIYYPPDDEEKILDILSDQLPLEEHRRDVTENLMRRIRF